MPIVQISLLTGRTTEKKQEIAAALTKTLHEVAGISPEATTVLFTEVAPADWVVGGKPLG